MKSDAVSESTRKPWIPVVAFAAISGWLLTAAALPRMCGVTENVVDAYLLEHPRIGFMLGLGLCLALMAMVVRSGKPFASRTSLWRLAVVVPFAWVVFEATHSLLATQWLYRSAPEALRQNLHLAVWVLLSVTALWAIHPRSHGAHPPGTVLDTAAEPRDAAGRYSGQ